MGAFITKQRVGDETSVFFNTDEEEILAIGAQMEAITSEAYMNGYNWEAFLHYYLQIKQPELLIGMDTDSESATYVALYYSADAYKADELVALIKELVNNPDMIYEFLKENGDSIEWDL